ncbi:unnamed protein product [Brachionus calyciflorus]|uniref:RanBP2-type domain-containing protein n=1 Tax=Brachionus calyciflorus TaxID=104777 RepID=A0A813XWC8_9BILA|nr:unnamed protein product [Brachionus calyciflorus]
MNHNLEKSIDTEEKNCENGPFRSKSFSSFTKPHIQTYLCHKSDHPAKISALKKMYKMISIDKIKIKNHNKKRKFEYNKPSDDLLNILLKLQETHLDQKKTKITENNGDKNLFDLNRKLNYFNDAERIKFQEKSLKLLKIEVENRYNEKEELKKAIEELHNDISRRHKKFISPTEIKKLNSQIFELQKDKENLENQIKERLEWNCSKCTFLNKGTTKTCKKCTNERDYDILCDKCGHRNFMIDFICSNCKLFLDKSNELRTERNLIFNKANSVSPNVTFPTEKRFYIRPDQPNHTS